MKTIIHTNKHARRAYHGPEGALSAPIVVRREGMVDEWVWGAYVAGPSWLLCRREAPLADGTMIWVETTASVFNKEEPGYVVPSCEPFCRLCVEKDKEEPLAVYEGIQPVRRLAWVFLPEPCWVRYEKQEEGPCVWIETMGAVR